MRLADKLKIQKKINNIAILTTFENCKPYLQMYSVNSAKLKAKRLSKNLSQTDIAELLFIEQTTYSKIETGKTNLKLDMAYKIATILQIELEDFIDTPPPPNTKAKCLIGDKSFYVLDI